VAQDEAARIKIPNDHHAVAAELRKNYFENAQAWLEFGWQYYYLAKLHGEKMRYYGKYNTEITTAVNNFFGHELNHYKEKVKNIQDGMRTFWEIN
jgi:hypothetical protein